MTKSRCLAWATGLAALALPSTAAAAEVLYGVTQANNLVTFHSDSPSALRAHVPITGLGEGEQAVAIDIRPSTGQLYLLGSSSRLFVVNPASGAATPLGTAFSPALAGGGFGVDFIPTADRIRLVSDGRQNLRLNPEEGQVAGHDGTLAYADGDPGAGTTPSFVGVGHTPGAESAMFVLDTARDVLGTSAAPNDGKISTVGPFGVDLKEPAELDFAADGRGWVVGASDPNGNLVQLWTVDPATGTLTAVGAVAGTFGLVRGIAAAGPVPDDDTRPQVLVAVTRRQPLKAVRRVRLDASCSETCALTATLRRGKRRIASGRAALADAGKVRIVLNRVKVPKTGFSAVLRVRAVDAAGNATVVRRRLRFG